MDWDLSPPSTPRLADGSKIKSNGSTTTPQPGDLIRLGQCAPQDFRGSPAVVTQIAATHCTVAVLDPSQRRAIGECWPNHCDCMPVSRTGRLGARVVIDGFHKGRGKSLNGSVGTIVAHRKEGHPCFVRKEGGCGDEKVASPVLVCCVELDIPVGTKQKQVLVEPIFLSKLPSAAAVAVALSAAAHFAGENDAEKLSSPCGLRPPTICAAAIVAPPLLSPSSPGPNCRAVGTKARLPSMQHLQVDTSRAEPTLGTRGTRAPIERRGSGSETPDDPGRQPSFGSKPPSEKRETEARCFADSLFSWAWPSSSGTGGEAVRPPPPVEKPVSWRELLCSSGEAEGETDAESDENEPLPALHCANCCAATRKQKKARKFPDAPVAPYICFDSRTRSHTECSFVADEFSPRSHLAPLSPRSKGLDLAEDEYHDGLETSVDADREGLAHHEP